LSSCTHNRPPEILPIGETRAVGKITAGLVEFEPGEDQAANYIIVTKAFFLRSTWAMKEVVLLRAEIERLQKLLERKEPK